MKRHLSRIVPALILPAALLLALACELIGDPRDAVIPQDIDAIESIEPAYNRLGQSDREVFDRWLVRHLDREVTRAVTGELLGGIGAVAGLFEGRPMSGAMAGLGAANQMVGSGIPRGMTIGMAIDEQRRYEQTARQ